MGIQRREVPCSENCSCGKNANGVKWVCLVICLYKAPCCGTYTGALMTLSLLSLPLQAYFRQGVALQYLGRHADALAAFASGLAQDPKSLQLLVGMVEAAMKSPLRGKKFSSWVRSYVRVDSVFMCLRVTVRPPRHLHKSVSEIILTLCQSVSVLGWLYLSLFYPFGGQAVSLSVRLSVFVTDCWCQVLTSGLFCLTPAASAYLIVSQADHTHR